MTIILAAIIAFIGTFNDSLGGNCDSVAAMVAHYDNVIVWEDCSVEVVDN